MNSTVMVHLVLLDCQAHALKQRGDATIGLARGGLAEAAQVVDGHSAQVDQQDGSSGIVGNRSSSITRRPSARSARTAEFATAICATRTGVTLGAVVLSISSISSP